MTWEWGKMLTAEVLVRSWLECCKRGFGGEERILCSRRDRARLKSMARISFDRIFNGSGGIDVMISMRRLDFEGIQIGIAF